MSARLVPWRTTREWRAVADALAKEDDEARGRENEETRERALGVARAWRARGRAPLAVDITASLTEAMHRTHEERDCTVTTLALAATIVRLVNGATDTSQGRFAAPVATLAAKIGLPRELVDLRHDATHDALPTLRALRRGATMALAWCRRAYWEPQREAFTRASADVRRKIAGLCGIEAMGRLAAINAKLAPESSESDDEKRAGETSIVRLRRSSRRMLLGELATMCPKGASHVLVEALESWPIVGKNIYYDGDGVPKEVVDERDWRPTLSRLCHKWPGLFTELFEARVRDISNACGERDWAEVMLMCDMASEFLAINEQKRGVEGALTRAAARWTNDVGASASAKHFVRVVQKLVGASKDAMAASAAARHPTLVNSLEQAKAAQAALVASMAAGRKRKRDSRWERVSNWTPSPIGVVPGVSHDELMTVESVKVRVTSGVSSFISAPRSVLIPPAAASDASDDEALQSARASDADEAEDIADADATALNVGGVRVRLSKRQRAAVAASVASLL